MWPLIRKQPTLLSAIQDLTGLLREQTALTRELVQAISRRPAVTPPYRRGASPVVQSAARTAPSATGSPRTASDVFVMSREAQVTQQLEAQELIERPWREGEQLPGDEPQIDRPISPDSPQ